MKEKIKNRSDREKFLKNYKWNWKKDWGFILFFAWMIFVVVFGIGLLIKGIDFIFWVWKLWTLPGLILHWFGLCL